MTAFDPRPVIGAIKAGRGLPPGAARGMARGWVSDAQAAGFAMAVLLRGVGAYGRRAPKLFFTQISWGSPAGTGATPPATSPLLTKATA